MLSIPLQLPTLPFLQRQLQSHIEAAELTCKHWLTNFCPVIYQVRAELLGSSSHSSKVYALQQVYSNSYKFRITGVGLSHVLFFDNHACVRIFMGPILRYLPSFSSSVFD